MQTDEKIAIITTFKLNNAMDFKDQIQQLADRIGKQKDCISTEEATKNAFIMPMLSALGYDVFNPFEIVPELDCDLIKKKGEKIDYAIMKDGSPILLMECKHCKQDLNLHDTQLQKYFVASKARFGVLTNGIEYRFYTDLEKPNIMDEKPFLLINMLDLSENDIEQLKKFHKSYYNEADVLSTANELKYTTELKSILNKEFSSPSPEFVRFFTSQVYNGKVMQSVIDQFTPLVKKSIANIINDIISERLSNAIKTGEEQQLSDAMRTNNDNQESDALHDGSSSTDKETGIITTQDEIDAYNIVRSILRKSIDANRITYKDNKTYFVVSIDNGYWWICRFYFGARKKSICFPLDNYKSKETIEIETIDDIFQFTDKLEDSLNTIINK